MSYYNNLNWNTVTDRANKLTGFFKENSWTQYVAILGIAISGLVLFINVYEMLFTDIKTNKLACNSVNPLKDELSTQFWWTLILSIIVTILAIVLGFVFAKTNICKMNVRLILIGILTMGILGILYAISLKSADYNSWVIQIGIPFIVFIGFLIFGFLVSKTSDGCPK